MKDARIRLVLDTSAVLAYASTSLNVGETIAEVVDEGGHFGASVLCLVEAARLVSEKDAPGVPLLIQHPHCVILPFLVEDWPAVAEWSKLLGRADLAVSLVEAIDRDAYVLTGELDSYDDKGPGELPIIPI